MRLGKLTPAQQLCENRRLSIERLKKGQQMEIEDMNHVERTIEEIPGELNSQQDQEMCSENLRQHNAMHGLWFELDGTARERWHEMSFAQKLPWAERCMKGAPYATVASDFARTVLS